MENRQTRNWLKLFSESIVRVPTFCEGETSYYYILHSCQKLMFGEK